jgi:hypothetical protein
LGYSGWRNIRKVPGNWEMLNPPVAEITSGRIGAFGRIQFDILLFGEHEQESLGSQPG